MSRQIEAERIQSGELSEDEVKYLQDRGILPDDYEPVGEGEGVGKPLRLSERANTGTVNTAGRTKEQVAADAAEELRDELNRPEDFVEDDEDDEEEVSYESLTTDELRAELSRRGLPVDGRKADLVERLTENDGEEEE